MAASAEDLRVERDALGEKEVPAAALYGIHTLRGLEQLSFSNRSLASYPALARALAGVKWAAATTNGELGILAPELVPALQDASLRLMRGELRQHLVADVLAGGGSIAIHMNVNEVLANVANESLGGRRGEYSPIQPKRDVGASQSTADVCHTASRVAIVELGRELTRILDRLIETFSTKAESLKDIPTLARTCLQDAMPTSLGVLFHGYAEALRRRRRSFATSLDRLRAVVLGSTVLGTGEGAPPGFRERVVVHLARVCQMDLTARRDPPSSLQYSDDVRATSAQLAELAETLIKIAQDLRLLASGPRGGFGEILLPHVLEGSSFFGDKRNPVLPETLLQGAFSVLAADRAVSAACAHAELYLNVFDGFASIHVMDQLTLLSRSLERFDIGCARGIEANEERCRALARSVDPNRRAR